VPALFPFLALLALGTAAPLRAQSVHVVRWPAFSDRPELVGAPDTLDATVSADSEATVAKFDCGTLYAGLAGLLGVSEATLAAADVIAFEGNGGSPGEGGGWESSKWLFTDGVHSLTVVADAPAGTSDPAGVVLANASITGEAYERFFGLPRDPLNDIVSFMLFDLPPSINVARASFRITVKGFPSGEGSPNPDAIGVLTHGCACAPRNVKKNCSVD